MAPFGFLLMLLHLFFHLWIPEATVYVFFYPLFSQHHLMSQSWELLPAEDRAGPVPTLVDAEARNTLRGGMEGGRAVPGGCFPSLEGFPGGTGWRPAVPP